MLKRAFSVVVVWLFLWTPGYAQTLGTITGEVKDGTGASLPRPAIPQPARMTAATARTRHARHPGTSGALRRQLAGEPGRSGRESRLDGGHESPSRLLAQLDRHPGGRTERRVEEIDVERVLQGSVLRMVDVDAGLGHREPAGRALATAVDVIHYRDMQEALESSQAILESGPYAVELTDKMILDLARENIEQRQRAAFIQGDPAAILIVEYAGASEAAVRAKVDALEARRRREGFGYAAHLAHDAAEQQSIWKLRKAGLGLLLGMIVFSSNVMPADKAEPFPAPAALR